jgi:hypothetical protein
MSVEEQTTSSICTQRARLHTPGEGTRPFRTHPSRTRGLRRADAARGGYRDKANCEPKSHRMDEKQEDVSTEIMVFLL